MSTDVNQQPTGTVPKPAALDLHGVVVSSSGIGGEVRFAIINFLKAIIHAQGFPGLGKFPQITQWVWSHEEAENFTLATGKLEDTFWKIDRIAELLEDARRKFVKLDEGSYSSDTIIGNQQVHRDFPLYLDMLIIYWRIFADSLAVVTSLMPGFKKKQIPNDGFRRQRDWFAKERCTADPEYVRILEQQTHWFTLLAGAEHGEGGLRNLLIHESVRTQLFYQPGETPDQNRIHAFFYGGREGKVVKLIPDIRQVTAELFGFLDAYVEHFVKRVEEAFGGPLPETHAPTFAVLYRFETELPSAWLYPVISPEPSNSNSGEKPLTE